MPTKTMLYEKLYIFKIITKFIAFTEEDSDQTCRKFPYNI